MRAGTSNIEHGMMRPKEEEERPHKSEKLRAKGLLVRIAGRFRQK